MSYSKYDPNKRGPNIELPIWAFPKKGLPLLYRKYYHPYNGNPQKGYPHHSKQPFLLFPFLSLVRFQWILGCIWTPNPLTAQDQVWKRPGTAQVLGLGAPSALRWPCSLHGQTPMLVGETAKRPSEHRYFREVTLNPKS